MWIGKTQPWYFSSSLIKTVNMNGSFQLLTYFLNFISVVVFPGEGRAKNKLMSSCSCLSIKDELQLFSCLL